jgi:hypothetical protein
LNNVIILTHSSTLPGLAGVTHNEEVDILAKEATKIKTITQYASPHQDQQYIKKYK